MRTDNWVRLSACLGIAVLLLAGAMFFLPTRRARATGGDEVRLLSSGARGIVLDLDVPAYTVEAVEIEGQTYHRLSIGGYSLAGAPGEPELPQRGLLLSIPPEAQVRLAVLETGSTLTKGFRIPPVPEIGVNLPDPCHNPLLEGVPDVQVRFNEDQAVYSCDAFFPSLVAEIGDRGYLRDQRYVQVLVNPVQYNPVTGELKHYHYIKLQVSFSYPRGRLSLSATRAESLAFETVLQNTILNYETAKTWRSHPQPKVQATSDSFDYLTAPSYKISVAQDGIYQLTYSELQAAGLPVGIGGLAPVTFQLFNMGSEVAIYVEGEDDGRFDLDDYILFYGQKMDSKYTDTNVYWLRYGGADGLRMDSKDGTPAGAASPAVFKNTVHLEEDHLYRSQVPRQEGADHWYWNYWYPPSVPTQSYATTLNNISTGSYTCTLRASFQGLSSSGDVDPDHHLELYINDQFVGDAYWDGQTEYVEEHTFPQAYLVEGNNVIRIEAPHDTGASNDSGFTNWFEIDYYDTYTAEGDRLHFSGEVTDTITTWKYHVDGFTTNDIEVFDIFDVTEPVTTTKIVSPTVESYILKFEDTITARREYLALTTAQRLSPLSIVLDTPSDLHATTNGADYIIITHSDFYTDVLPLANHRAAQGPRTLVIDVQDVYDEFSYGIFDAQAIHDFLAYAYANWQPLAPSYVLLVGDGNYDFKNNLGTGEPNYIPPYLAMVDPFQGETAADNRYVTVNGSDILPDMHIGRLLVQTSSQAGTMVGKILNYEQNPPSGDWNKDAIFVADDADVAGDFAALSDDIVDNYIPSSYTAQKVYYKVTHSTVDGTRAAIVDAINEGRLLVNYIGHGYIKYWAGEKIFRIEDIASLNDNDKLPMMLSMTCLDGYFHAPNIILPCLDESIVSAEGKGAVASWSPTGSGLATGHHYLNRGFFTAVFTDNIAEIGMATYLGKLKLYTETGGEGSPFRDLMDTFVLFGDPFMKLNLPACDAADYDNDGRITVADVMQVAAHWDTEWGDANFDRKYDLDDDGDVDIVDVMWVAGRWEEVC